jgi:hypothetical protein
MKTYTSPSEAALTLLGVDPSSPTSYIASKLRGGMESDRSVFSVFTVSYGERIPVSALIAILSSFGGRVHACLSNVNDRPPADREGFYGRHSASFHSDSFELEERVGAHEAQGLDLCGEMIERGVNVAQASEAMSLGTNVDVILTGSFLDFAGLYRMHGPVTAGSHPAARAFALSIWADMTARFPQLITAYNQVSP